jgi:hypothetical protein
MRSLRGRQREIDEQGRARVPRDCCEGERFKATTSFSTVAALGLQYFRQLKMGYQYVYTDTEIKSNLLVQFLMQV